MLYNRKWADLDKLGKRAALVSLLRDKSRWPRGFEWDYECVTNCACALAYRSGLADGNNPFVTHSETMADTFGISRSKALSIFFNWRLILTSNLPGFFKPISPEWVANRLEKTL